MHFDLGSLNVSSWEELKQSDNFPHIISQVLFENCTNLEKCVDFTEDTILCLQVEMPNFPLSIFFLQFDCDKFKTAYIQSNQFDFDLFLNFSTNLCKAFEQGYNTFISVFFESAWQYNDLFQINFIKFCLDNNYLPGLLENCPTVAVDFLKCPADYPNEPLFTCWKFQCLYQVLIDLSKNQSFVCLIEEMFAYPLNKCPELVVLGLLQCTSNHHQAIFRETIMIKAILKFLYPNSAHLNATQIFQKLWPSDYSQSLSSLNWSQRALLNAMAELYNNALCDEQQQKLSRILDLSQDLKALNCLLSCNFHLFVIDLACLASRREYLKLDKWLTDKIKLIGKPFIEACMQFVKKRCAAFNIDNETSNTKNYLPPDTLNIIFCCFHQYLKNLTQPTDFDRQLCILNCNYSQYILMSSSPILSTNATFQSNIVDSSAKIDPNILNFLHLNNEMYLKIKKDFGKEIEEEANLYFKKVYRQDQSDSITIEQFLDMMKLFQESNNLKENDLFYCIIRNIIQAYKYLNEYPDRELVITAHIFGGIIDRGFFSDVLLPLSLQSILESLKTDKKSKLFRFAVAALDRFKNCLYEFPRYCKMILEISDFNELPSNLKEYIKFGKSSMQPTVRSIEALSLNTVESSPQVFNEAISQLEDKLHFIFNNLDKITTKKHSQTLKVFLDNNLYFIQIADCFVRRALLEQNHHSLFIDFLDAIQVSKLFNLIIEKTYTKINYLLVCEDERKLLKCAGQWLGLLTLARNKPILSIYLDIRSLLVEAHNHGLDQLIFIVPFVAKILAACVKSKVFRPPNPWTVSLISILGEVHSHCQSTLNLKFEVEVLCQTLGVNYKDYIGKSSVLKTKPIENDKIFPVPSQVHTNDNNLIPVSKSHELVVLPNVASKLFNYNDINISNLSQALVIQHNLKLTMTYPALKIAIKGLIEENVKQWIDISAERFVNITVSTTELLIKKDFALEPNAELMKTSAHNMVCSLLAGYSLISTREFLSSRINASMQELLLKKCHNISNEIIESTSLTIINDNIDLCVAFVQKICIERGIEEINRKLKSEFDLRLNSKSPYYDSAVYAFQVEKIPPSIRLNCGLTPLKKIITYDEMGKIIPGFIPSSLSLQVPSHQSHLINNRNVWTFPNGTASNLQSYVSNVPSAQLSQTSPINDALVIIYDRLIKHLVELIQEFECVHHNSQAMHEVLEILKVAKQNPRDSSIVLTLIKNVVYGLRQLLLSTDSTLQDFAVITRARDFYLLLLKAMTDQRAYKVRLITNNITRYVMENWFTFDPSFPDDLFDILSKASLINFVFLNEEFCALLENTQSAVTVGVIIKFLRYYLPNGICIDIFTGTFEHLHKLLFKTKSSSLSIELKKLFIVCQNHLQKKTNHVPDVPNTVVVPAIAPSLSNDNVSTCFEKIESLFNLWTKCFNDNSNFNSFLDSLRNQGFLKSEDVLSCFFSVTFKMVVERTTKDLSSLQHMSSNLNYVHQRCFVYLDAYSYLLIFFIKLKNSIDYKLNFLKLVLEIITSVAIKDQEVFGQSFHYLPYYRVLVVLFLECFNNYSIFGFDGQNFYSYLYDQINIRLVQIFCTTLHQMSPNNLPSFIFAWLEFISHRSFIGKCLSDSTANQDRAWHFYFLLLCDLLIFEKPFMENIEISKSFTFLYKGTLKLFLLLLHDFPEFLCEYCYLICDLVPRSAFQLRNLILSAYPASIRLPDPYYPNLRVEDLNEILQSYRGIINKNSFEMIPFKKDLDLYMKSRVSVSFLKDLHNKFNSIFNSHEQLCYINLLIFYIGQKATQTYPKYIDISTVANDPSMDIIQSLLLNLDTERRYFILSSIVNHLRYPNLETQYFICALLYLFKESDYIIKEQIMRVLLERLFVYKPHPWSLLFIIKEISKNPIYNFWNYDFIKFEPLIKKNLCTIGIVSGN